MKTKTLFFSSLIAAAAMSTVPAFADAESIQISYGTNENNISTGNGTISYSDGWNKATNNSNSTDAASIKLCDSTGAETTATTTWTSKNTYMWNDAETGATDEVLKGYLDDGGSGVTITVSNISYLFYDVTVIASTDSTDKQYTAKTINGQTYTSDEDGNGILGSDTWGNTSTKTVVAGDNSFTVSGLYRDLSLSSTGGYTGARGCIAGLIITNATSADAAVDATISANSEWKSDSLAGTTWKNDASSETQRYANLKLSNSATLNVTETDIKTHAIIATATDGDATLTLSGKDVNLIGPGVVRTDSTTAKIVINNTLNFSEGGKISGNVTTGTSGLLHVSGGELDAAASAAASLNVSIDSGATYALTGVGTTAVSAKVSGEGTVAVVGVASDFTGGGDKSYITLNNVSDTSSFTGTVELRNVQAVVSGDNASSFANASKVVLNSAALHFDNAAATFSKDIEIGSGQNGYVRSFGYNKISSGAGATIAGNVSGAGTLTSSDDGDVTFTGTVDIGTYVARTSGGISVFSGDSTTIGTLTMNSGTTVNFTGTNTITTANLTGGTLSGGNITTANVTSGTVAVSGSTISTLSQTAGTLDFTGTGTTTVGSFTGPTSQGGGTNPTTNVNEGATVDVTNNFVLRQQGQGTSTLNVAGTLSVGGALTLSRDGNGIVNINDRGTLIAGSLGFGQNWDGTAKSSVVNVNTGGTLIANGFTKANDHINSSSFNLSGGTLGTSANSVTLNVDSLPVVLVAETTSTINTGKYDATAKTFTETGSSITIANVISGSGALNVFGAGTLTLSGENTYTGGTTISAGTLVAKNASALGTGNVTVKSGAELSTVSGTQLTVGGNLTTESGAFLGMNAATTDAAAIAVTGTVSLNAGTIFDFSSLTAGESLNLKLVSGEGVSSTGWGLANLSVNGALVNQRGEATFSVSDNVLSLVSYTAGGAATLTWNADSSGAWENAGSRAWTLNASTDKFYNGDTVIFNTANAKVELSGAVNPAAMTVSAVTTLSGSGTVSVAAAKLTTDAALTLGDNVTLDLGSSASAVTKNISGTGTVKFTSTVDGHSGKLTLGSGFTGTIDYTGKFNTSNGTANSGAKFRLSGGTMWGSNTISNDIHFVTDYQIGDTQETTITLNGKVTNESGTTLTIGGNGGPNVTFGGEMAVSTLKQTSGTLNISGTGTTTIGTFTLTGSSTLDISGTGTRTFGTISTSNGSADNSTLTIAKGTTVSATSFTNGWGLKTLTVDGTLNVDGTFQYADGATDTITGSGTISANTVDFGNAGTYNVSGVTLEVGSGGITHTNAWGYKLNLGATTIKATSDFTIAGNTGGDYSGSTSLTDTATGTTFDTNGHTITVNSALGGSGSLVKTGVGTLTLSGTNTFSGGVTISAGKVVASNASALGAATGSVKIAGGQLEVSSGITLAQTNITIALSDAYSTSTEAAIAAILGEGALAEGTTITLTKVEEAVIDSLVKQTKEYQIFASGTSLASNFSVNSFTLDEEAWADWKISGYDAESGKVTLEMIPEPSAFGLLAGVGALVFVAARRRRRAK